MADFELLTVTNVNQLHENLTNLLKNKKHIESIVVDTEGEEIRVDLSRMANSFGKSDFRLKLRHGKGIEARGIIEVLKSQEAPTRGQSDALFALLAH